MGNQRARNLVFGLVLALFGAQARAEVLTVPDLGCGIVDTVPGHLIPDCAATEIVNFHVNPDTKGLDQRLGSVKTNASQLAGKKMVDVFSYAKRNGNEYLISIASKTIAYSSDNGATWTTLITTATDGAYYSGAYFTDDNFYLVSQNDGGMWFTGTALSTSAAIPAGKFIQSYQNRLWVADTAAYPYRLYFSGLLLPTSWTLGTDYIDFPEEITAIGKPYNGGLPVYTANQTWMLRGSDPTNFYLQQISNSVGCAHARTIQNFNLKGDDYQVLLSKGVNQTENNLYAMDGTSIQPIGDNVLRTLAGITTGNIVSRFKTYDTQSDFNTGTFTNTTSSRTVGNVMLSTYSLLEDFSDGNLTVNPTWTTAGSGISVSTLIIVAPTLGNNATAYMDALNDWSNCEIQFDAYVPYTGSPYNDHKTIRFMGNGTNYYSLVFADAINRLTLNSQTGSLASFDSPTIFGQHEWRISRSSSSIRVYMDDALIISTSDANSFTISRFEIYCKNNTGANQIQVDNIGQTPLSGRYVSQKYQTDTSLTHWDQFAPTYSENGGTIRFQVRTANSEGNLDSATWTDITSGGQVSSTINQWVQWAASMTITDVSQSPIIDEVTLNWQSNAGASQPMASAVFRGDYWLTYTGGDESRNQSILLMNKDGAVSTVDGINAYSLAVERGRLFSGDSTTDTVNGGYVRELETGNSDDGAAITARVSFKNQQLALDDYEKTLSMVYLNHAVDVGTFTATMATNFSARSANKTVNAATGQAYSRKRIVWDQQTTGTSFGLTLTNSYAGSRLRLYPPMTYHFEKVRLIP